MKLEKLRDGIFGGMVLWSKKTVLVEFTSDWCKQCKVLESTIEKLADEKEGKAEFFLADYDDCRTAADKYQIKGLPTVIVFRDEEEISRFEGITTREKLLEMLGV